MENYRPNENNFYFKKLLKDGENSENPLWQLVLDGLRQGDKGWKTVSKDGKHCRHPGVRDAGNRCVFCILEKKLESEKRQSMTSEQAKEDRIKTLREQADQMDNGAAMLRAEAFQIEIGLQPWPPEGLSTMSRQQALQCGSKWYMPTKPCKHCGITAERYVANGRCRSCGK